MKRRRGWLHLSLAALLGCAGACTSSSGGGGSSGAGGASSPSGAGGSTTSSSGTGGAVPTGQGGSTGSTGTGGAPGAGGNSGTGGAVSGAGGARAVGGSTGTTGAGGADALPARAAVVNAMRLANDYFMAKWPDPGVPIVTDKSRASNIWTRAVYYEGLMALYAIDAQTRYYDYAVSWGTSHTWTLNNGATTTSADDQCAGQTYLDLYKIPPQQAVRLTAIKANIDLALTVAVPSAWSWVDAIQMAMPVYARLGVTTGSTAYFDKMYAYYSYTKNTTGGNGLYSKTQHLWWRDQDFVPPYVEPNGQDCFWSRGNGWAYAALVRVLSLLPATDPHRAEYLADFVAMSDALRAVQRSDGFWNVSLHDPTHLPGKELTGTALFTYGMAWGVLTGNLPSATYRPIVVSAWNAMVTDSLHTNGFLGWVQGSGKQPSDGQPVTADHVPDFEDYGLGCFLLAGSQVAALAAGP
jgi:unsaturated rhamnogalacturonyl hydrolase